MKKIIISFHSCFLLLIFFGCLIFLQSCTDNKTTNPSSNPSGKYLTISVCDSSKIFKQDKIQSKLQDCVELDYSNNSLNIKHLNAVFNCCPDSLHLITIDIKNNIITIDETKTFGKCFCDCLFEINYQITNLPKGEYKITFIENLFNSSGGDLPLECTIDLKQADKANACMDRSSYLYDK